jgi:hypothetical protein
MPADPTEDTINHFFARFQKDSLFWGEYGRMRVFFVRRRAHFLAKQHPDWAIEPDQPKIRKRLEGDLAAVEKYVRAKVGTLSQPGPIISGVGDKTPKHLDLRVAAKTTASMSSGLVDLWSRAFRLLRRLDVICIVWRATAIHVDLWKGSSAELETDALDEILDRRLHALEIMTYNVNGGEIAVQRRLWKVMGAAGPWKDGQLVRIFEYMMVPKKPFEPFLSSRPEWKEMGKNLLFHKPALPDTPIHFPPALESQLFDYFGQRDNNVWVDLKDGALTPAEVFQRLFTPSDDFLKRSWLFCDHVATSTQIEALRFGLERRLGNSNLFNQKMKDYVSIGPLLQPSGFVDQDRLMSDDADPFFENILVSLEDLQVGDLVIFWNSPFYDHITGGAWKNEFSLVTFIENDERTGEVRRAKGGLHIKLAGHGIATTTYSGMANELAAQMVDALNAVRQEIQKVLISNPNTVLISYTHGTRAVDLVKWAPYGESFDPPGAWWLRCPKTIWQGSWGFTTTEEAAQATPLTVYKDDNPGAGYIPPGDDSIFFPLYEPAFPWLAYQQDSWNTYLKHRRTSDQQAPKKLREVKINGRIVPGLLIMGKRRPVIVIRPKVRK